MSAARPVAITIFFDVVSPYSWLAFEVLVRYRKAWGLDLRLRPIFLGGVMRATKNRPPAMVPAKGAYMGREMVRSAAFFGVPLRQPADFASLMMRGTLLAQRALTAVAARRPGDLEEASRQMWMRTWSRDLPLSEPAHVAEALVAAGVPPPEADALAAAASLPEAKEALAAATQEAVDSGAFGAPWIVVDDETYFGSDRFEQIAEQIGRRWDGPRGPKPRASM